jgi:hypothetical protein
MRDDRSASFFGRRSRPKSGVATAPAQTLVHVPVAPVAPPTLRTRQRRRWTRTATRTPTKSPTLHAGRTVGPLCACAAKSRDVRRLPESVADSAARLMKDCRPRFFYPRARRLPAALDERTRCAGTFVWNQARCIARNGVFERSFHFPGCCATL